MEEQYKRIATQLMDEYAISDYEAIRLAIEMKRNEILERIYESY